MGGVQSSVILRRSKVAFHSICILPLSTPVQCLSNKSLEESGWFSGHQPCLPPLRPGFNYGSARMWAEFQSISICLRGFFSGCSGFPPSSKSTPGLFHQAVVLCSEVIHGSCSGAERLAGSTPPSVRPR